MTKNEFKLFCIVFCEKYKGRKLKSVFKYKNLVLKEQIINVNSFKIVITPFDISFCHKTKREILFLFIDECYVFLNNSYITLSNIVDFKIHFEDTV